MKPNIGLSNKKLENSTSLLSSLLADEMTLYIKTRKFHWNVSGESFMELHKLFEGQYKMLEVSIDEVAERISKLGEKVTGSMKEFVALSRLKESVDKYPNQKEMLAELLENHEALVVELRKDVEQINHKHNDAGTADFLTGLIQQHETIAWVLRRYLN